jgi:hypothetical protein
VQQLREADVRTLHTMQLQAQKLLVAEKRTSAIRKWIMRTVVPLMLKSPLLPRIQRRMFFGVPLPPIDPAFSF